MKNLVKATLLAFCLSATSVWADVASSPVTYLSPTKLGQDTVGVANMINSYAVQRCVKDIEDRYLGEVHFTRIEIGGEHSLFNYSLDAVIIAGGDIAIGNVILDVTRTMGIPWGPYYSCRVRTTSVVESN